MERVEQTLVLATVTDFLVQGHIQLNPDQDEELLL